MKTRGGVVAILAALAILCGWETFALTYGYQSLSRAMFDINTAWPPAIFLAGMVVGGLAVHLLWYWDPRVSNKGA